MPLSLQTEEQSSGPAVLFVPVSGPNGSGEYYRTLTLARALLRHDPALSVHIVISREANRLERGPSLHYHAISGSPTRSTPEVLTLIDQIKPAVAVFDCGGRMVQYRAVRRNGGRVVWMSNRPNKRRKGFRLRMMRELSSHFITSPGLDNPRLSIAERLKLWMLGQPDIHFYSIIAPEPHAGEQAALLERLGLTRGHYILFAAGGGGYEVDGRPVPELLLEAARTAQRRTGVPALVIMGPQYEGDVDGGEGLTVLPRVSNEEMAHLLDGAMAAVTGGGNMMVAQVLAAACPAILLEAGGNDQAARIALLKRRGLARHSPVEPEAIVEAVGELLGDPAERDAIRDRIRQSGIRNESTVLAGVIARLAER